MQDFQRGWYIQLLLRCATSERPGYLRLDSNLGTIAGAKRSDFWETHKSRVLACFKVCLMDGEQWIFNPRLLKTLEEQTQKIEKKQRRKIPLRVSISDSPALSIYESFPRKEGRRKALEEIDKAISRLATDPGYDIERKLQKITDETSAARFIHEAVLEFAKSPAGNRHGENGQNFVPHPSTWFHQDRFLDERSEWYAGGTPTNKPCVLGKCDGSGMVPSPLQPGKFRDCECTSPKF